MAKILVIDDEMGIREGCRRVLEPLGFSLETAATIREGLAQIRTGAFDLVLLDVMMPDGRGLDVLEPAREQDPDLVVIIITGYATVELAVEAIKAGAYDFISKPFTADLLVMTVNQGLERRRLSLETKRLQAIEREAEELAQQQAELERLHEFTAMFTYQVAHELRAPVAGAISLLRPMLRGLTGELNDNQRDILSRIEKRLDMLLELVNDLLDLSASKSPLEEEPARRVDLAAVLERTLGWLAVEAEHKGLALESSGLETASPVLATEEGLERILDNLIGNAVKYTPAGGRVSVAVEAREQVVELTVADSGIGIPAEDLPGIWAEFSRGRNARAAGITGTGLGLSIVKQLVERFAGQITVESVEGQGTTFRLTLPRAPGQELIEKTLNKVSTRTR